MINIMDFSIEEIQLIAIYMPKDNRLQVIKSIVADNRNMDDEVRTVAEKTVDKLAKMSDEEFAKCSFVAD